MHTRPDEIRRIHLTSPLSSVRRNFRACFRVQGSGFRIWGIGLRFSRFGIRVQGRGQRDQVHPLDLTNPGHVVVPIQPGLGVRIPVFEFRA